MCLYTIKKDYIKKIEKDDDMTRFWYTLKNLDPSQARKQQSLQKNKTKMKTRANLIPNQNRETKKTRTITQ
jgi:hypothetical protein